MKNISIICAFCKCYSSLLLLCKRPFTYYQMKSLSIQSFSSTPSEAEVTIRDDLYDKGNNILKNMCLLKSHNIISKKRTKDLESY